MSVQRPVSQPSPLAPGGPLPGRERELKLLEGVFRDASASRGSALVLRGEAGVGKTALLTQALRDASGTQTLSVAGAEFEMELPFAALQQLCSPLVDGVASLPPPQRAALEVAFGIRDDVVPNHLLIGLAMLGLLSDAGQEQTLRNWRRQDQRDRHERDDGPTSAELEELRQLRRENARLRQE